VPTLLAGVEDADLVLLVGSDPRAEAPVLNARLRRANIAGGTHVASIGPHADLTYPVESLGLSAKTIEEVVSGKHPFAEKMKEAQRPLIIVGASLLRRADREGLLKGLHALADATGVVTAVGLDATFHHGTLQSKHGSIDDSRYGPVHVTHLAPGSECNPTARTGTASTCCTTPAAPWRPSTSASCPPTPPPPPTPRMSSSCIRSAPRRGLSQVESS
jgi:hypothetical protein